VTTRKVLSCNNNNTNGNTIEALHSVILPSVEGWMHHVYIGAMPFFRMMTDIN